MEKGKNEEENNKETRSAGVVIVNLQSLGN
jgi:hypothetical protein